MQIISIPFIRVPCVQVRTLLLNPELATGNEPHRSHTQEVRAAGRVEGRTCDDDAEPSPSRSGRYAISDAADPVALATRVLRAAPPPLAFGRAGANQDANVPG